MERKWVASLFIGILVLSGCATIRSVDRGKTVALAENEAVIFGRVILRIKSR